MLRQLRRIAHGWRAEKADTLLTALVFLLFAALLSLTLMFSGGSAVAEKLSQTIPFNFRYENRFLFGPRYQASRGEPYLNLRDFAEAAPEDYLKTMGRMLDGFEELGHDARVSSYNYGIYLNLYCSRFPAEDETAPEDGFTSGFDRFFGASGLRFFEDNGLELLSNSNPDGFNEDGIFVPDTCLVPASDGKSTRPMQPGDRVYFYTSSGEYIRTLTVQGVYHFQKKFDYNYGEDVFFNSGCSVILNDTIRSSFLNNPADVSVMEPRINYPIFRVIDYRDFDGFRQRMQSFYSEFRAWCIENEVNMPALFPIAPQFQNVLRSAQSMSRLYSIVLIVVAGMLVVLMAGLLYYLISKKKREMFLYFSLGAKKREIARHYGLHYGALALPAAILGCVPGILLNGALSSKVSADTLSLQEALLRYSNNGQIITRSLKTVSFFDRDPATLARASLLAVAGTTALAVLIGVIGAARLLRGNLRDFARGSES